MNKDLIQSRFAKNLKTYNENARIQKRMAERLITFLNKNNYAKILEIGCGTGFLTELINNRITFEKLTAIDIVEDCRNYINNINPESTVDLEVLKIAVFNVDETSFSDDIIMGLPAGVVLDLVWKIFDISGFDQQTLKEKVPQASVNQLPGF